MPTDFMSEKLMAVYDAAFSKNRWNTALDAFIESSNAAGVLMHDVGDNRCIEYTAGGLNTAFSWITESILPDYNQLIAEGRDSGVDREGSAFMHAKPPFRAVLDTEIWTIDETFKRRPEIVLMNERVNTQPKFFINLSEDPLSYSSLIVHYDCDNMLPAPISDMRNMELLSPHLGKVLEINRTMFGLRQKYNAVLAALDHIDVAIFILNDRGHSMSANKRARDLVNQRDGIWIDPAGKVVCRLPDETAKLRDATRRVCATANGENDERSHEFEIKRASSPEPLYCTISPLRDADMELEPGLTGAMLTIVDGDRELEPNIALVSKAYKLSAAECKVAYYMAKGLSNLEASEKLGLGSETVKTHIASILGKTQSRNRLAFIWKVFQFSPPIL